MNGSGNDNGGQVLVQQGGGTGCVNNASTRLVSSNPEPGTSQCGGGSGRNEDEEKQRSSSVSVLEIGHDTLDGSTTESSAATSVQLPSQQYPASLDGNEQGLDCKSSSDDDDSAPASIVEPPPIRPPSPQLHQSNLFLDDKIRPPTVNFGGSTVQSQLQQNFEMMKTKGTGMKFQLGCYIYQGLLSTSTRATDWGVSQEFWILSLSAKTGKILVTFKNLRGKIMNKSFVSDEDLVTTVDSTRFFLLKTEPILGIAFCTRQESGLFCMIFFEKMQKALNIKRVKDYIPFIKSPKLPVKQSPPAERPSLLLREQSQLPQHKDPQTENSVQHPPKAHHIGPQATVTRKETKAPTPNKLHSSESCITTTPRNLDLSQSRTAELDAKKAAIQVIHTGDQLSFTTATKLKLKKLMLQHQYGEESNQRV
ncbi:hypothetical protein Pelo_10218 [Pelomyxa schiedti]|nr:hypothetical protein Pelo_10218 [Pelomyxa schiedti]